MNQYSMVLAMTRIAILVVVVLVLGTWAWVIGMSCDDHCQADQQWELARARWEAAYSRNDYEAETRAWKDECYWYMRGTKYDSRISVCESLP
jgi:hypothetical protein